jgi:hypothetical protein
MFGFCPQYQKLYKGNFAVSICQCVFLSLFQQGEIEMEVVFVAPDEDSDDENAEYEDDNGFR